MFLSLVYQQKIIKNHQKFLTKDFKDQFSVMNKKQKVRIKMRQMSISIFSNQL